MSKNQDRKGVVNVQNHNVLKITANAFKIRKLAIKNVTVQIVRTILEIYQLLFLLTFFYIY